MHTQDYDSYMTFASPEQNPWDPTVISGYLRALGAANPTVTRADAESILRSYDQAPSFRLYHGPDHGGFVGQPDVPPELASRLSERFTVAQAQAVMAIAGLFHDAAYKHVDAIDHTGIRAWPTVLRDRIGDMATYTVTVRDGKPTFTTTLTEAGSHDAVTRMTAHMFGVSDQGIIHNQGGNEFDSALSAAKFLEEKGVAPKYIVAVVAAIAATIPFKPARGQDSQDNTTDGFMGELAEKVKTTLLQTGDTSYQPDWQDVNDIMLLGVHLANRDISPFVQQDNFGTVIQGGRGVKKEEIPELRQAGLTTIQQLARAALLERSAPYLYRGLGGGSALVSAANVPHLYIPRNDDGESMGVAHAYPPESVYEGAVAHTERNTWLGSRFFEAHEAGIVLVASIATLIGEPDALVPGIVDASQWHTAALPQGEIFDQLDNDERCIFEELMHGTHQTDVDAVTTRRSPIGGMIFGALGSAGIEQLSQYIKTIRDNATNMGDPNPFSNYHTAAQYVREVVTRIGSTNFHTILTELQHVASYYVDDPQRGHPNRSTRLETLRDLDRMV